MIVSCRKKKKETDKRQKLNAKIVISPYKIPLKKKKHDFSYAIGQLMTIDFVYKHFAH